MFITVVPSDSKSSHIPNSRFRIANGSVASLMVYRYMLSRVCVHVWVSFVIVVLVLALSPSNLLAIKNGQAKMSSEWMNYKCGKIIYPGIKI